MCGRYALGVRMAFVRQRLQEQGMPVDEAANDEDVRETYNFAPGYNGAVYRADIPDRGYDDHQHHEDQIDAEATTEEMAERREDEPSKDHAHSQRYRLQGMRWGLIPFWTKRQPDYGSLMRTINCRDDSLIEDRGMWTSMKRRKRCVIVCQGFYEWLKKGPGGKEKVPHFIRRKDGDLVCFAGLWDCVSYEGSDEKLYTYTIITTSSNSYLKFLHDRMPVILEPGSEAMKTWLDPTRTTWSNELQSILRPYEGELECYPVSKEVGKVGNNSPDFIIPIDSKENRKNIANFFANAKKKGKEEPIAKTTQEQALQDNHGTKSKVVREPDEQRATQDSQRSEDNAPIPVPSVKRERPPDDSEGDEKAAKKPRAAEEPPKEEATLLKSPSAPAAASTRRKTRSATQNRTETKAKPKTTNNGTPRITNFFKI